eukprot:Gb_01939 [translate_table: standard]
MARFGEGDKRWIVEDRPDGTNVHNWHWVEKDCLEWSKKTLSHLLENISIMEGEANLWIKTTKIEKVEGEAYVNIRKGKIIPGYEISVRLLWEGEAKDGDGNTLAKVEGRVELPYIADENADEDPDLKISVKDEGPVGQRLREAFLARGKPVILKRVRKYVDHMTSGGPAKEELETKAGPKTGKASLTNALDKSSPTPPKPAFREGFKTIGLTERFNCRAQDIYDILMDENKWKGFSQSSATISREVGGSFSLFDGAITGFNQELQVGKLIVQKWRFGSWVDDLYSTVCMTFEEPEVGLTIVKLTQTDVPEEDRFGNATVVENTERGWRELIFHKIRAVFGYGI